METVIGVVLLILAIVGTILVLNSVVSTVRRWARRAHAPHPTQEPEGTQADPRLQKVREAAAKLSREYMWLDADVLEQDSLFKSTVADLSRPEVDASVALKAAKSSSDFEAAIGFAALAARA